jgi:ankyrin repeat protein
MSVERTDLSDSQAEKKHISLLNTSRVNLKSVAQLFTEQEGNENTELITATYNCSVAIAQSLINVGASLEIQDQYGSTALIMAA